MARQRLWFCDFNPSAKKNISHASPFYITLALLQLRPPSELQWWLNLCFFCFIFIFHHHHHHHSRTAPLNSADENIVTITLFLATCNRTLFFSKNHLMLPHDVPWINSPCIFLHLQSYRTRLQYRNRDCKLQVERMRCTWMGSMTPPNHSRILLSWDCRIIHQRSA